jgi:hypothetical protein
MISNPEGTRLLSSLGWVEGDALWQLDVAGGDPETIALGTGARYSSLHDLGTGRFAIAHHFDGRRFEVSVRGFSQPREVLAHAMLDGVTSALTGDSSAWKDVPTLYVEYLGFAPWKDFVLLAVSPASGRIEVQRLGWYDDSYDKGYQGIVDVLELPDTNSALVSVQRSSRLVVHDLESGAERRGIDLCGGGSGGRLMRRKAGKEIWTVDYDTLAVLLTDGLRIDRSARLQDAPHGVRQFVGDFAFAPDRELCVVARPFSGDVVAVDEHALKIRYSARVGRQPFEVAALAEARVLARDWKTGDLLRGTLERR